MRLSDNFFLHEFTRSQTAARMGRDIVPTPPIIEPLERLAQLVLQPIRSWLGRPITVTSGFRPAWLNIEIGGSPRSEHVQGRAADFVVAGMTAIEASRAIARLGGDLPINQHIFEFGRWTHVSVAPDGAVPRRQLLTAYHDGQGARYVPGVVELVDGRPANDWRVFV